MAYRQTHPRLVLAILTLLVASIISGCQQPPVSQSSDSPADLVLVNQRLVALQRQTESLSATTAVVVSDLESIIQRLTALESQIKSLSASSRSDAWLESQINQVAHEDEVP